MLLLAAQKGRLGIVIGEPSGRWPSCSVARALSIVSPLGSTHGVSDPLSVRVSLFLPLLLSLPPVCQSLSFATIALSLILGARHLVRPPPRPARPCIRSFLGGKEPLRTYPVHPRPPSRPAYQSQSPYPYPYPPAHLIHLPSTHPFTRSLTYRPTYLPACLSLLTRQSLLATPGVHSLPPCCRSCTLLHFTFASCLFYKSLT